MEDARAAVLAWQGGGGPERERLRAVELASPTAFHAFASRSMSAAYQPIDLFGAPMLVLTTAPDPAVLAHELAHAITAPSVAGTPRWFFEGIACYLETLRRDGARVVVGAPSPQRLERVASLREEDYARVLAMPTREAVLLQGEEAWTFQSASWLAVSYLANEHDPDLRTLLESLSRGDDARLPGVELAPLLVKYANAPTFRTTAVEVPPADSGMQMRDVARAEVAALRAELFFLSPGLPRAQAHLAEARAAALEALALDPGHPLAFAVLQELGDRREVPRTGAHDDDYRAWMLVAATTHGDERRTALGNAARLAPRDPVVLSTLAWHEATHGRAQAAVPVAERAAALSPRSPAVLDTLAVALALSNRCSEAAVVETRVAALSTERRFRARLDAMRAGCGSVPVKE